MCVCVYVFGSHTHTYAHAIVMPDADMLHISISTSSKRALRLTHQNCTYTHTYTHSRAHCLRFPELTLHSGKWPWGTRHCMGACLMRCHPITCSPENFQQVKSPLCGNAKPISGSCYVFRKQRASITNMWSEFYDWVVTTVTGEGGFI